MANESQVTADKLGTAEKKADMSYTAYVESIEDTRHTLKEMRAQVGEVEQAADEAEAETAAAKATSQGGVVSVTDAMKLMNEEKVAKAKQKQVSAKYMSQAANAFGESIGNGVKILKDGATDAGKSLKEGMTSTAGIMSLGAGIATAFLPDALQSPAAQMMEGWLNLADKNKIDDGVEEKAIAGYDTPENAAISAVKDNYQEPPAYSGSNTGTGTDTNEDKNINTDEKYVAPAQDDAAIVSGEELNKMANLDAYLDELADNLENSDNVLAQSIGKGLDLLISTDTGKSIVSAAASKIGKGGKEEPAEPEDNGPELG